MPAPLAGDPRAVPDGGAAPPRLLALQCAARAAGHRRRVLSRHGGGGEEVEAHADTCPPLAPGASVRYVRPTRARLLRTVRAGGAGQLAPAPPRTVRTGVRVPASGVPTEVARAVARQAALVHERHRRIPDPDPNPNPDPNPDPNPNPHPNPNRDPRWWHRKREPLGRSLLNESDDVDGTPDAAGCAGRTRTRSLTRPLTRTRTRTRIRTRSLTRSRTRSPARSRTRTRTRTLTRSLGVAWYDESSVAAVPT